MVARIGHPRVPAYTVPKEMKDSEIKHEMYLGLSPIWRKVFVVKFLDISLKLFAIFLDSQIGQKQLTIHRQDSNRGTLDQEATTLTTRPYTHLLCLIKLNLIKLRD
jgi:hypothetical protein